MVNVLLTSKPTLPIDTLVLAVIVFAIIGLFEETIPVNCPPALGKALLAVVNAEFAVTKAPLAKLAAEFAVGQTYVFDWLKTAFACMKAPLAKLAAELAVGQTYVFDWLKTAFA